MQNRKTAQDWGGWFELLSFFVLTFLSHPFVWFRFVLDRESSAFFCFVFFYFSFAFKYKFCVSSALFFWGGGMMIWTFSFGNLDRPPFQEDTPRCIIVLVKVRRVNKVLERFWGRVIWRAATSILAPDCYTGVLRSRLRLQFKHFGRANLIHPRSFNSESPWKAPLTFSWPVNTLKSKLKAPFHGDLRPPVASHHQA